MNCPSDDIGFHSNTSAPCYADWFIEIWGTSSDSVHASDGSGPPTELLGACTLSVFELLTGEQRTISAATPIAAAGGLVIGTVRVLVEARPMAQPDGLI